MKNNIELVKEFNQKIEKSFFGTSDLALGGAMNPEVATSFFEQVKESSPFLSQIMNKTVSENTVRLDTLEFIGQIIKIPDAEGSELGAGKRSKPTPAKTDVVTKEIVAQVDISYQSMWDVIDQPEEQFKAHVGALMAKAFARDVTKMALSGIALGVPVVPEDLFDGFIELAQTGGHIVDAANTALATIDVNGNVDKTNLGKAVAKVVEWGILNDPGAWWFLAHPSAVLDYQDVVGKKMLTVADMNTADRYDAYRGIRLESAIGMPDYTQPYASDFSGSGNSSVLLAEKQNMVVVYQKRNVMMKTWDQPLAGLFSFIIRSRIGVGFVNKDRTAVINNVKHNLV